MPEMMKNEEVDLSRFPASRKVYVEGSRPDIQVPMREISLSRTEGVAGEEENEPLRVYDTSGIYTDAAQEADIRRGCRRTVYAGLRSVAIRRNTPEELCSRRIMESAGAGRPQRLIQGCSGVPCGHMRATMLPSCIMRGKGSLLRKWSISRSARIPGRNS